MKIEIDWGIVNMCPKILLSAAQNVEAYIDAVKFAGGEATAAYCPAVDLSYDGLILCGGRDIDPGYYGEEIDGAVDIDHDRDTAEFALAKAYIEAGKPVFGICRGSQLLNVYFGGTLHQHLENTPLHRSEGKPDRMHGAVSIDGSVAAKLFGKRYIINSVHHQAVNVLGSGLRVSQLSDDGVIEGFEHETLPVIAVQWHPERLVANEDVEVADGAEIFKYFIEMCK